MLSAWRLGVLLAIVGNLLIAFSLVLQKHVHMLREQNIFVTWAGSDRFLFALAMAGLILGEVGNFAAFGLASPVRGTALWWSGGGAISFGQQALKYEETMFLNQ